LQLLEKLADLGRLADLKKSEALKAPARCTLLTRLLGFSPSQGELVAAYYPFEKTVNGFAAGFKAVLLFQAPRYF
jgi:hypothetical protein